MFYKKYANKTYSGDIQFEFEDMEFVVEGKPYYANGLAIINYDAESDDQGRLGVEDYEIYELHLVTISDHEGEDVPTTKELIAEIMKMIDDTPKRRERIYEKIFDDIDES